MTKIYTGASMSLDGYIAGPNESGFEHLFKWYGNGDVEVPTTEPDMPMQDDRRRAPSTWRAIIERTGALDRRPQAVRLHERLGRQAPDGRARSSSLTPQRPRAAGSARASGSRS